MIASIIERLDRIERKIDDKLPNRFLDINEASQLASVSISTIRRAVKRGELKCSRKLGKLLFKVEWMDKWLKG